MLPVGPFLIAYGAHSPLGNIATAVIACVVTIVYVLSIGRVS